MILKVFILSLNKIVVLFCYWGFCFYLKDLIDIDIDWCDVLLIKLKNCLVICCVINCL